jgi:glycosyltransferase involved in cell wall biosynthesis
MTMYSEATEIPRLIGRSNSAAQPVNVTICTLIGCYLPGYRAGGPIRSIANLMAALGEEFDFRILTLDRDHRAKTAYPGVISNQWVRVGRADVMYLRPGLRGFLSMYALLRSVDGNTVLYVNSFFARRFSMLPMFMRWLKLCRPRSLVLAPRGEFSLGALGLHLMRKRLFIGIARRTGLYQGVLWHASSEYEAADIQRLFPEAKQVEVAEVLLGLDARDRGRPLSAVVTASDLTKWPGQLRAVFVARCSRMKNLSGALRMLAGILGDVSFDIYGPKEDLEYWEECQRLIAALPPNIRVRYEGEIEHERVADVLAGYDLFLFPTLGENYGHVISEALASGCPVLISDQTPWRNLEAEGIGWDIPLSETERFRSVLQQCVDGDDEWFTALSKRAMDYVAKRASAPETIDANRNLFKLACGSFRHDTNL